MREIHQWGQSLIIASGDAFPPWNQLISSPSATDRESGGCYLFEMASLSSSSPSPSTSSPSSSTSSIPSNNIVFASLCDVPKSSSDIIELFEDVEGISIYPFEEWKFGQYFTTADPLIQPILAAKRLSVGNKFSPVQECSKIIVRSRKKEEKTHHVPPAVYLNWLLGDRERNIQNTFILRRERVSTATGLCWWWFCCERPDPTWTAKNSERGNYLRFIQKSQRWDDATIMDTSSSLIVSSRKSRIVILQGRWPCFMMPPPVLARDYRNIWQITQPIVSLLAWQYRILAFYLTFFGADLVVFRLSWRWKRDWGMIAIVFFVA